MTSLYLLIVYHRTVNMSLFPMQPLPSLPSLFYPNLFFLHCVFYLLLIRRATVNTQETKGMRPGRRVCDALSQIIMVKAFPVIPVVLLHRPLLSVRYATKHNINILMCYKHKHIHMTECVCVIECPDRYIKVFIFNTQVVLCSSVISEKI